MSDPALLILLVFAIATAGSWFLAPAMWARMLLGLAIRSAGLNSEFIEADGVRWRFLRGGKGPTLLLLHGFGADATCWLRLARELRHRFSLLIPDLPGFGRSEPPDRLQFTIEAQVGRLVSFLDALQVERCLVAGNSMGGYLATALAARDPQRVRALWLLAPLGVRSVSPGEVLESIDEGDPRYLEVSSYREYRRAFLQTLFSGKTLIPGPVARAMAKTAIERQHLVPRMLHEVRFESEALENIAVRVTQPVLVQWGADDRVVSPEGVPELKRKFRNVSVALTEQCGHLPMLEKPRESAGLFLDFLEEWKPA